MRALQGRRRCLGAATETTMVAVDMMHPDVYVVGQPASELCVATAFGLMTMNCTVCMYACIHAWMYVCMHVMKMCAKNYECKKGAYHTTNIYAHFLTRRTRTQTTTTTPPSLFTSSLSTTATSSSSTKVVGHHTISIHTYLHHVWYHTTHLQLYSTPSQETTC